MSESFFPASTGLSLDAPTRAVDRWARSTLLRTMTRLEHGSIEVCDAEGQWQFGDAESPLRARIEVGDARFYRDVVLRGALGAGEAWIDGR